MLDIELALELMKKYGYSSTTVHPYIYQSGDNVGICYTYEDEDYGVLERVKLFDSLEAFEEFLKQLDWVRKNGLNYHVRMCLDNYEAMVPKTLFLRNEKLMMAGEMDDIETYDLREKQREGMSEVSKLVYEAGDLLLIYDEVKARQLDYLLKVIKLKNQLRQKYYDLQKAVDEYNKIKIEREMVKIPEVPDSGGIDVSMEIALKDRYNIYVVQEPPLEEAQSFIREVWNLNKSLEMNVRYYDALREETEIRNEMKIVDKKIELMDQLNENLRPLFGVDLISKFRKINKSVGSTINYISKDIVNEKIEQVQEKYKYFDNLELLFVADYLREAFQNSNYTDLCMKYGKGTTKAIAERSRTPLNEVAADLFTQYKSNLTVDEQAILVIYNNPKFRKICNAILTIPKFDTFTPKQVAKRISSIKDFSKLKSECYISLRDRINNPLNQNIKASLFKNYDFTTFETFVESLMRELARLKQVNNKMYLTGDINMYLAVRSMDEIKEKGFVTVTNDLKTLLANVRESKAMIGITLLKEKLPVLYSPYFLDLGDIYNKEASPKLEIREMINFELLVESADMVINIDKTKVNVTNYYSDIQVEGNVSVAVDIKAAGVTTFVKYSFLPNSLVSSLPVVATNPEAVTEGGIEATATVPQEAQPAVPEVTPVAVPEGTPAEVPVAPIVAAVAETPVENQPVVEATPVEQKPEETAPVTEPVPAEPAPDAVPVPEEVPAAPVSEEKPAEEKAEEVPATPVVEEQPAPEEPPTETTLEPVSTEEKPVEEPVQEEKAEETKGETPVEEPKKEEEPAEVTEEHKEEEQKEETSTAKEPEEEKKEEPKEEVKEEKEPEEPKEDDIDKALDAVANILPKDSSKVLEDTNKMDIFADLRKPEPPVKKPVVMPKVLPHKEPVMKKIVNGPAGSKKVVVVKGAPNQPTLHKPVVKEPPKISNIKPAPGQVLKPMPSTGARTAPMASGQVRKVVRNVGQQGAVSGRPMNKIVKRISSDKTN